MCAEAVGCRSSSWNCQAPVACLVCHWRCAFYLYGVWHTSTCLLVAWCGNMLCQWQLQQRACCRITRPSFRGEWTKWCLCVLASLVARQGQTVRGVRQKPFGSPRSASCRCCQAFSRCCSVYGVLQAHEMLVAFMLAAGPCVCTLAIPCAAQELFRH